MGLIKESSKVTLYSGVSITTGLQIIFSSVDNQRAYFAKHVKFGDIMVKKNFSYLRKGGKLKLELPTSDVAQCDYLSFINPAFENKEFYAKIVNYEYVNNKVTEVTFAIDDFQTYMFDVNYEFGTIEREHLSEINYQKSLSNPYDPSIYEFQTEENLKVNKQMEEIYDTFTEDKKNASVLIHPAINDDLGASNLNSCIILQLATFNESEFSDASLTTFKSFFDMYITTDGEIYEYNNEAIIPGFYKVGDKKANIGRGYTLYMQFRNFSYNELWEKKDRKIDDMLDWLTVQGLTGNIIGLYQCNKNVWDTYVDPTGTTGSGYAAIAPRTYNVDNKKLLLSPYQYIRVYNNEGDCKEYQYEYFKNISKNVSDPTYGVPVAEFQYLALFDGAPMVSLVPVDYKREGTNPDERIDIHQIPQIGYSTDAFLSFMATQYNMNLASRTNTVNEKMNSGLDSVVSSFKKDPTAAHSLDDVNSLGDLANVFGENLFSGMQALSGSISNISGMFSGDPSKIGSSVSGLPVYNLRGEVSEWRSGGNIPNSEMLSPAKGAYVADDYHAGSTNGTLGYYLKNARYSPGSYIFIRVKLRDEFLKVFDLYFSGYGYNSGRIGTPRVCAYIKGDSSVVPHFSQYFDKKVTYVKTSNMHVDHTLASVASNIENMFNNGCQFQKGEDLD